MNNNNMFILLVYAMSVISIAMLISGTFSHHMYSVHC